VLSLFQGLVREMISLGGWVGDSILRCFSRQCRGASAESLSPLMSGLIGFC